MRVLYNGEKERCCTAQLPQIHAKTEWIMGMLVETLTSIGTVFHMVQLTGDTGRLMGDTDGSRTA